MSYKAPHKRVVHPITGYDIHCDESGTMDNLNPSVPNDKYFLNEDAIVELLTGFDYEY